MTKIIQGDFGTTHASRETIHELYYVSTHEGVTIDQYITRAAALTATKNLEFHPTTHEIDLLALTIMKQYNMTSIFDAYHAATALNMEPDRTLISTDKVFDKIPGLTRLDPRQIP